MHRRALVVLVALVLLFAGAPRARAHVTLERAQPRGGSTLRSAPSEVKLWFTGDLEPAFSRLRVVNEAGDRVDRDDAAVDGANRALLRASLGTLPPGRYRVVWRVVSVDAHVTEGEFSFRVAP
ncbi:MAG: hypothetical protein A3F92_04655 [Candidatus Rokubacteria bacterium RIFCSPLOWO2_12_FULL_71_22]|nr:MAG: hypothetical protein A3F92_04655 [Candidatus Rokubacteria bacterium RIFCSPLOWO2_12_FULL_71_22]